MTTQSLRQLAKDKADQLLDGSALADKSAEKAPNLNLYHNVLDEAKKGLLDSVMRATHGNQSKAASVMGINRATLRGLLKRFEMAQH